VESSNGRKDPPIKLRCMAAVKIVKRRICFECLGASLLALCRLAFPDVDVRAVVCACVAAGFVIVWLQVPVMWDGVEAGS